MTIIKITYEGEVFHFTDNYRILNKLKNHFGNYCYELADSEENIESLNARIVKEKSGSSAIYWSEEGKAFLFSNEDVIDLLDDEQIADYTSFSRIRGTNNQYQYTKGRRSLPRYRDNNLYQAKEYIHSDGHNKA